MNDVTPHIITLHEIDRLTAAEGEGWGYPHVRRLLALGIKRRRRTMRFSTAGS